MNKTVTVTLSRAHKLAERLKAGATERFHSAQAALAPRTEYVSTLTVRAKGLTAAAEKAKLALDEAVAWSEAAVGVRAAIGAANQTAGVAAMLAEQAGVNQRLNWFQQLVATQGDSNPELSEFMANVAGTQAQDRAITLSVISSADQDRMRETLAALKRQAFALSDRIAVANAATIELSLPPAIADQVLSE